MRIVTANPSKNQLFVLSHDEKIRAAACVIRSLDGRTMYEGTIDFELGLSLSNLTMVSGVYMMEIHISETNETLHQQFVYLKE